MVQELSRLLSPSAGSGGEEWAVLVEAWKPRRNPAWFWHKTSRLARILEWMYYSVMTLG
jgi:hypothetical protein